ncbi:hypothetical protein D3C76_1099520 [compost metagenome]
MEGIVQRTNGPHAIHQRKRTSADHRRNFPQALRNNNARTNTKKLKDLYQRYRSGEGCHLRNTHWQHALVVRLEQNLSNQARRYRSTLLDMIQGIIHCT